MKINTRDTVIRLDPDVHRALKERLEPQEKITDLANEILRVALGLPLEPQQPTFEPHPPKDPEQSA